MSNNRTFKLFGLLLAALMLVVAGAESLSYAVGERLCGCGPTTPCRCAADGVCRPKRETWGHYNTRWRTWPGEPSGRAPVAESQTPDEATQPDELGGFELPKPEQEDLRVPPKSKKKKADGTGDEEAMPGEMPADAPFDLPGHDAGQLLPGPEAPPAEEDGFDVDPFGLIPEVPEMEDAPPALPPSLRQAARTTRGPQLTKQQLTPAVKQRVRPGLNVTPEMLSQRIRQVGWQQLSDMPMVNPAAAVAVSPAEQPLQQAVYYEASDRVE